MKTQTKQRIKAAIDLVDAACWIIVRRIALRWARKVVDALDERVQAAHVRLREEISLRVPMESPRAARTERSALPSACEIQDDEFSGDRISGRLSSDRKSERSGETFTQWEAQRSGVAPVTKKSARRRHRLTAAQFDRSFA